jgi:ribosomal protein S18 acetylase RimI-like enzyme
MTAFALRPALEHDLVLAYEITKDAMRAYVEETWSEWNENEQLQKHQANFDPATHRIVLFKGAEAGLLVTEEEPEFLWLVKLYLFRAFRNQGLGSALLAQVVTEANAIEKSVRLRVLRANTAAQRFYTRHGFKVVGEEPERLFMVRTRGDAKPLVQADPLRQAL